MRNTDSLDQVYRRHNPDDDYGGDQDRPQSQPFLDDVAGLLAIAAKQESQHEKPRATRQDGKKHK
jgi:hypothetical protein